MHGVQAPTEVTGLLTFSGANGWPGMALPVREPRQGQPSLLHVTLSEGCDKIFQRVKVPTPWLGCLRWQAISVRLADAESNAASPEVHYSTNNGTITITGYNASRGMVTIPSTIAGLPVPAIGHEAFLLSAAAGIVIPAEFTDIGSQAFLDL